MRWGWLAVAAAVLVAGVVVDWFYKWTASKAAKEVAVAQAAVDQEESTPVPVETVHVAPGGIVRTSTQIGTVRPFKEADLYAKISGYLKELHVDYGSHVKEGELLAVIDDPEVVKEAEKAAADVDQSKAAVAQGRGLHRVVEGGSRGIREHRGAVGGGGQSLYLHADVSRKKVPAVRDRQEQRHSPADRRRGRGSL